jgi:predicted double-glycine peptidase
MVIELIVTLALGTLAFMWGRRVGNLLVQKGATVNNLFAGKNWASLLFLALYIALIVITLHVPQWQGFPVDWRIAGLRVSWSILRVILMGFCGLTFAVSWKTARIQVVAIALIGILGFGAFTTAENFVLQPIHRTLEDNLLPNGMYQQTSNSSCAPTALANLLRIWQIPSATESTVAKFAGTSRLGTSMPQLITAAKVFKMDGLEFAPTWEQMRRINRPGVLSTWLYSDFGRDHHAVTLVSMTNNTITLADPAFGKLFTVVRQEFPRIWRNEYLAIFRPGEQGLSPQKAAEYLYQEHYLAQPSGFTPTQLKAAIQEFQGKMDLPKTGELTPETVLMLTGPFLKDVPTLGARGGM